MAQTYTILNPSFGGVGAKEFKIPMHDEGKLFKSGGIYYKLQGGELYSLDPQLALGEKIFGSVEKAKAPSGVRTNSNLELYLQEHGATTQQAVENLVNKELGIDANKIPEYNFGDVAQYIINQYNPSHAWDRRGNSPIATKMSLTDFNTAYKGGNIATTPGRATERDLSGLEAPKLITGEGGPKDLQGNLIPVSKYAEMGITPPTPVTPQGGAPGASGEAIKAGQRIPGPSYLANFKESDIARTTGINIYKRDLSKEQSMIGSFSKLYGKQPASDTDWRVFHDYVYEGKTPGA